MKKIATLVERRPHYYRGQLLLEDDFLAEQTYHIHARRRHNLHLHGWGIVRGLDVERESDNSIRIKSGFAVDAAGNDVLIEESKQVDLSEFGPNEELKVEIFFDDPVSTEAGSTVKQNRLDCTATITVTRQSDPPAGVMLATVRLDEKAKIGENAIDSSKARRLQALGPGSITAVELNQSLKTGWLRLSLRSDPLVNVPKGEKEIPPPFRVGATEALSPDPKDADERDRGAAGTMGIPIPPGATRVTRLRLAGSVNEGKIHFKLVTGGWDEKKNERQRTELLDENFEGAPFLKTFPIKDGRLDPEYQTLSLWIRGTRRTSISLVAVEFVYFDEY